MIAQHHSNTKLLSVKKNNFKLFFSTILIILGSGSIADIFLSKWLIIFSTVVLLLIYSSYRFHKFKLFLKILLTIIFFLIFSYLVSPYKEIGNYLLLFVKSLNALLFVFIIGLNSIELFTRVLRTVLIILLVYGLINYFVYPLIQSNLFIVENEYNQYYTFNYIFFYGQRFTEEFIFYGIKITRNAGFFWEPGVNQFFLNMLLFIEINLQKKINKKILILTLFSILSTYSTIGVLILGVQLFLYSRKKSFFSKKINLIGTLFSLLILFFSIYYIIPQKLEMSSFSVRALDFVQSIQILMDNFLFGIGINGEYFTKLRGDYSIFFEFIDASSDIDKGNSNSILTLLLSFGFPIGMLLITYLIKQKLFREGLIFSSILFLTIFTSPLVFKPFFIALIISSIVLKKNTRNSSHEILYKY